MVFVTGGQHSTTTPYSVRAPSIAAVHTTPIMSSQITPSTGQHNPWGDLLGEAAPKPQRPPPLPYMVTAMLKKVVQPDVPSSPDGQQSQQQSADAPPATKVTKLWGPLTEDRLVEVSSTDTEIATGVFVFNNQDDALAEDDEGFSAAYVCGLDSDGLTAAGFQKDGNRFVVYTRPASVTRPSGGSASFRQSASKAKGSAKAVSQSGSGATRQCSKIVQGKPLKPAVIGR